MSLVEMLVSLAITAMLLTAMAAAYAAASDAVRDNDQFFRASQACRVSVNQILAQVRTCQGGVVDPTNLELTNADGQKRTYWYDAASKKLVMTIDGLTPITATLASNVDNAVFSANKDASGQVAISVDMTVKVGRNQI